MTWSVVEHHDSVHVLPNNDTDDHYFVDCHCGVVYQNGVYIHASFDGREILENMNIDGNC